MSSGRAKQSLYLIDAHSLIYQVFHALPEMSSPDGLPTNALFGFTKDLLYLRNEKRPDYLVCVFDHPGPTFREKIYPQYKAQRGPMPDDLQLQIPLIHQVLEAMHIPVLSQETFEADDLIATVAVAAAREGMEVFICSSDKDCRQLLDEKIKIFNLRKRQVLDAAGLQEEWGIRPDQVVDLQALMGDAVDNVEGVPGIGLKTAAKLLQEYQTLDNLLEHVNEISGAKRQENLRTHGPKAVENRKVLRLVTDVALPLDWENWKVHDWDAPGLLALFRQWGFQRLAEQVRSDDNYPPVPMVVQGDLFEPGLTQDGSADSSGGSEEWGTYHLVDTEEKFERFYKQVVAVPAFAVDLETTSLQPRQAEIVGLAFSWRAGEAWYVPVRGPSGEVVLDADRTLGRLKLLFEKAPPLKVNQNIKYDLQVLRQHGVRLTGIVSDPMVADYLLHAGERSHSMEALAQKHLNHRVIPISDLIGKGKNQLRMDQVPTARVAEYSGEDADVAWRLCQLLEPLLEKEGWHRPAQPPAAAPPLYLYDDLEIPLIEVLAELEFNGIRLDLPRLQHLSREMDQQLQALEKEIYQLAGRTFNIASLKELRQVLFEELRLPIKRKTDITGKASTDQETLVKLAREGHELPQKLVEHRRIAKLKGTYVDALPALLNPRTGRIHTQFNQTVAATGRLTSSSPNLQNIPIRSEQGGQIRQAFLPAEGWSLLSADYSQIELRLLAHFSQDAALRRAFALDRDIHALVAAQIFGVPEADVTPEMRRTAKTINFGVIYGMSAFGLAQRLEMSQDDAARFIEAYFARYPTVLGYQDALLEKCRRQGYVSTILGRRRAISGIRPQSSYKGRTQPEREAINMEIQGSAADLIKVAMVNLYRRLHKEKMQARMLLQIHDELVFEAPPEEIRSLAAMVRQEMTEALAEKMEVPLKVDVSVGPNWLEVEEWQI